MLLEVEDIGVDMLQPGFFSVVGEDWTAIVFLFVEIFPRFLIDEAVDHVLNLEEVVEIDNIIGVLHVTNFL